MATKKNKIITNVNAIENKNQEAISTPINNTSISEVSQKWDSLVNYSLKGNMDWINAWGKAFATNPYVQNQRLKQIKTIGQRYTREQLEEMLRALSTNELGLRKASRYFHNTVAPIMKMNNMYPDILTYRNYIDTDKVNNKKGLQKEYEQLVKWKKSLDIERTFRNIVLQSMIEGKTFWYLREEDNINFLQPMPSDWVKVVHRTDIGWQYSFNMFYFLQPGVSPDWFAPIFKEYLAEFYGYCNQDTKKLDVSKELPPDVMAYYEDKNWYFWKQIPPEYGWIFSIDDSIAEVIPPLSSMFLDANELNSYKLLEQELMAIPLKQIMTATVPLTKENKSGSYVNDTAVSPDLIQLYQNIIQQILPQSVDFIAAPFDNFNVHTFDSVASKNSIVGDSIQNFYSQSAVTGLLSTTNKPNISMVKTTQILETGFIDKIYSQINCFLRVCVKNKKYKNDFTIIVEGDRFGDKDLLASLEKALASGNKNLYPQYLSFFNQDVNTAIGNMDLIDSYGIYDRLQPTLSAFQMSKKDEKPNGRPSKSPDDMTSEGSASSAESGSNTSEAKLYSFVENLDEEKIEELIEQLEDMGYEVEN